MDTQSPQTQEEGSLRVCGHGKLLRQSWCKKNRIRYSKRRVIKFDVHFKMCAYFKSSLEQIFSPALMRQKCLCFQLQCLLKGRKKRNYVFWQERVKAGNRRPLVALWLNQVRPAGTSRLASERAECRPMPCVESASCLCSLFFQLNSIWGQITVKLGVCTCRCARMCGGWMDGWMERWTQRAIAAPFPSTCHPIVVTPCQGSGLTHGGPFFFSKPECIRSRDFNYKSHNPIFEVSGSTMTAYLSVGQSVHQWVSPPASPAHLTTTSRRIATWGPQLAVILPGLWHCACPKQWADLGKDQSEVTDDPKETFHCCTRTNQTCLWDKRRSQWDSARWRSPRAAWSTCPYLLLLCWGPPGTTSSVLGTVLAQSFQISPKRKPRVLSLLPIFAQCTLHRVA